MITVTFKFKIFKKISEWSGKNEKLKKYFNFENLFLMLKIKTKHRLNFVNFNSRKIKVFFFFNFWIGFDKNKILITVVPMRQMKTMWRLKIKKLK